MKEEFPRREFLKKSTLGAAAVTAGTLGLSAKSYAAAKGANNRIRAAIFGCSRRFKPIVRSLNDLKNTEITWVCDVNAEKQAEGVAYVEEHCGYIPNAHKDLRKILEKKDVDVIFIALPDHWHAAATWMALEHGKDVYVEKPCSHNPRESELLIAWQRRYGKVVQMGNQQRSAPESIEAVRLIHGGAIGDPYLATTFYSNDRPALAKPRKVAVPNRLDWDLFQGPAPRTDFLDVVEDYDWHWFWHWGTAEAGNNAMHELDIARWALQVRYPEKVSVQSGKYHFPDDGWTMYDTMEATFRFSGGRRIKWDGKSRNSYQTYGAGRGTVVYGTEGSMFINRDGFKMYGRDGELTLDMMSRDGEAGTALGGGGNVTTRHISNFLEAIRNGANQNSPINEGAWSTQLCHYANISSREGDATFEVDAETGHIKDKSLMEKYWSREYEPGWELKA